MTTDAGSGFDNQAAARDAGDERLEEESRHLIGEDAGDGARGGTRSAENVNDASRRRGREVPIQGSSPPRERLPGGGGGMGTGRVGWSRWITLSE